MKTSLLTRITGGTAVIALTAIVGCSSSGTQRAEATVSSLDSLIASFEGANAKIDATLAALDGVVAAANGGDLKGAYQSYVTAFTDLQAAAATTSGHSKDMNARTEAYLQGWQQKSQEITNPELKERLAERLDDARSRFGVISDELDRIGGQYKTLETDLSEIKLALDLDLNPAGVNALSDVIASAKTDAVPLKTDIDEILEGLRMISDRMRVPAAPPPTTGGGEATEGGDATAEGGDAAEGAATEGADATSN